VVAVERLVAHAGLGGAIVETLVVVGIAAVFAAVYLRERRVSRSPNEEDQS